MKKMILALALGLSAVAAHANDEDPGTRYTVKYDCHFSEPSSIITYDSYSKSLSIDPVDGNPIKYMSGVTSKVDEATKNTLIVSSSGSVLLTIKNEQGSNGMNDDIIYPLTGIHNGNVGGCGVLVKKIAD